MANMVTSGSAAALAYQRGWLSSEGLSRYQRGQPLNESSFKSSSAVTAAYQNGLLSSAGVSARQTSRLRGSDDSFRLPGWGNTWNS